MNQKTPELTDHVRSTVVTQWDKERPPRLLPKKKRQKRNRHKLTKVSFFHYGYLDPAFKFFTEQVLNCEYLPLPEATKRTIEMGAQNSSDYVCTPFKHILGDFIDALEAGADVLVQFGGPCRLGYYGELQESILRDMGYDFIMLNFSHGIEKGYVGWTKEILKMVNPDISIPFGVKQLLATGRMITRLDAARDFYLANAGFADDPKAFERTWDNYADALRAAKNDKDVLDIYQRYVELMREIPLHKPNNPIRIGIVGEMFTAFDARSNLNLDQKLMDMGVEVHRMLNFSNRYIHYNEPNMRRGASRYLQYDMGPTSTLTIYAALRYAQEGFDGVIHAKSAGCTPEIDCVPVLQRISEDYKMPILYLTYDAQTSDTGLDTRLEAFYDMLAMKKEKQS